MFWLSFLLLFETGLGADWEDLINSGSLNGYFTYDQYFQFVNDNLAQFKDHFTILSAGKTSENQNDIEYVKLSVGGERYLGGLVPSLKSAVMITAGQVTTQPLAVTMTLYILSRLLNDFETKPDAQMLLQSMDL